MVFSCWYAKVATTCGLYRIDTKEDSERSVHAERRKNGRGHIERWVKFANLLLKLNSAFYVEVGYNSSNFTIYRILISQELRTTLTKEFQ